MALTVGELLARLSLDDQDFQRGVKAAEASLKATAKTAGDTAKATEKVGAAAKAAGAQAKQAGTDTAKAMEAAAQGAGKAEKQVSIFRQALRASTAAAKDYGRTAAAEFKNIDKSGADWQTMTRGITGTGAALMALAGTATAFSANFEQAMSSVAASGQDARNNINALSKASIEAGANSAYSATESAGAVEELMKAGVSAADVLGGGLTGALDLAAAGAMGVADAAGVASVAMTQFSLKGSDVPHVADLLAAAAGKAMGEVSDFGEALKQGGLVASQTGLSIEETTGALAAFASAGLLGSDAGTSLKTMLQRLTPQSKEAREQFEALGISAYDASGEFVGLENFAGQLRAGMEDLTPQARNAALSVMFGSDAVRAASVIYEQGAEGVANWVNEVDDAGYAAVTAATKLDNLKGDIEGFGGAIETAMIRTGSATNDALRLVVSGATGLVNAFNDMPPATQAALGMGAGVTGMSLVAAGGIMTIITKVSEAKKAMEAFGKVGKLSFGAIGLASAGLSIATGVVLAFMDSQQQARERAEQLAETLDVTSAKITASTREMMAAQLQTERGFFNSRAGHSALDDAEMLGIALNDVVDAAMGSSEAMDRVNAAYERYWDSFEGDRLAADDARHAYDNVSNAIKDQGDALEKAQQQTEAAAETTEQLKTEADKLAEAEAALKAEISGVNENLQSTIDANQQLIDQRRELNAETRNSIEQEMAYHKSLEEMQKVAGDAAEGLKNAKDSERETFDLSNVAIHENVQSLLDFAAETEATSESMRSQGASHDELVSHMEGARAHLVKAADQMGLSRAAAEAYADELGLIPEDVVSTIGAETDAAQKKIDELTRKLNDLQGKRVFASIFVNQKVTTSQPTTTAANGKTVVDFGAMGGYADGGPIHGAGTRKSDSIPTLLSAGEHVVTAEEVEAMGGHSGVYAWRKRALAGDLPKFANGGAVEDATSAQAKAKAAVAKQRAVVKDEKADVKKAQKAYDNIDGKKENAAAKKAAKKKLDKQKKELDAAEKKLDDLKDDYAEAKRVTSRLKDDSRDLSRAARRGEVTASASASLSGGLGLVDELYDQSRNKDLSKKRRAAAAEAAASLEKAFTSAWKNSERLNKELDKATEKADQLASIQAGVKSIFMGEFKLADSIKEATAAAFELVQKGNEAGDVWYEQKNTAGTKGGVTAKDLLGDATGKLGKMRAFGGKLDKLAAMGISGTLLAEIANEGIVNGTLLADALIADPKSAKALSGVYADIDKVAGAIGASATKNTTVNGEYFAGGVTQAAAAAAAIQRELDAVNDTIAQLAKTGETALLAALGLKKDKNGKVVAKANGGAVYGAGTGTSDSIDALLSAGEHVLTAREVTALGGHSAVNAVRKQALTNADTIVVRRGVTAPQAKAAAAPVDISAIAQAVEDAVLRGMSGLENAAARGTARGAHDALTGAAGAAKTLARL